MPGFAKYFKKASDEERDHAQLFMDYQVKFRALGPLVRTKKLLALSGKF